jgi:hypothetical protein
MRSIAISSKPCSHFGARCKAREEKGCRLSETGSAKKRRDRAVPPLFVMAALLGALETITGEFTEGPFDPFDDDLREPPNSLAR